MSFFNREFVGYIVPTTLAFSVGAMAIEASSISAVWAYAIGFAFSIPVEIVRDWFQDWYEARKEVEASA